MKNLNKLTLAQCKRILESKGKKYNDKQVEKIRDVLYSLGELDYHIFTQMKDVSFNLPFKKAA